MAHIRKLSIRNSSDGESGDDDSVDLTFVGLRGGEHRDVERIRKFIPNLGCCIERFVV